MLFPRLRCSTKPLKKSGVNGFSSTIAGIACQQACLFYSFSWPEMGKRYLRSRQYYLAVPAPHHIAKVKRQNTLPSAIEGACAIYFLRSLGEHSILILVALPGSIALSISTTTIKYQYLWLVWCIMHMRVSIMPETCMARYCYSMPERSNLGIEKRIIPQKCDWLP